jgi:tetratricopeptide (TPR) repeat protein
MGLIYVYLGDYCRAMEHLQQTLTALQGERRYQSIGGVVLPSVNARASMIQCLSELGEFATGVAYGNEALQIAEAVDRPYERLTVYSRIGYLYVRQGTLYQAIPLLERAVALSQEVNIPNLYRLSAAYLALAYALAGCATDALPLLGQIEGYPVVRGEAYLLVGEMEEADRLAQRGLANARDRKMRGEEARALWLLGEIAVRRDPPDVVQAEAHYQQALALAEELGMRPLVAHCHHGLGRLYHQTGRAESARVALSAAIDLYRAMDMTLWLSQAEATLARVEERGADSPTSDRG